MKAVLLSMCYATVMVIGFSLLVYIYNDIKKYISK